MQKPHKVRVPRVAGQEPLRKLLFRISDWIHHHETSSISESKQMPSENEKLAERDGFDVFVQLLAHFPSTTWYEVSIFRCSGAGNFRWKITCVQPLAKAWRSKPWHFITRESSKVFTPKIVIVVFSFMVSKLPVQNHAFRGKPLGFGNRVPDPFPKT